MQSDPRCAVPLALPRPRRPVPKSVGHARRVRSGVYGVLGEQIAYSLSPWIFQRVFASLEWPAVYALFDRPVRQLRPFLNACADAGIVGLNVTKPFKTRVIDHLSGVDRVAARIGAVNTVVVRDGSLYGCNTDVDGICATLAPYRRRLVGRRALIFGAGGAARVVAHVLFHNFEMNPIILIARSAGRARQVARHLREAGSSIQIDTRPWRMSPLKNSLDEATLVVNATPLGGGELAFHSPLPKGAKLPPETVVLDLVYRPRPTVFLRQARRCGCRTVLDGWRMLVTQAEASFRIWTGRGFPAHLRRDFLAMKRTP